MPLNVYIARQPIVTASEKVYGYELLFRSLDPAGHIMPFCNDELLATAQVLVNALNHFGIKSLLNDAYAFVNINEEFLLDDLIFNIPKERFILEILETVIITPPVLSRIKELKEYGYRLALDDAHCSHNFLENFQPIFPYLDVLKLDVSLINPDIFAKRLDELKHYSFETLAEKVETREEFETYKEFGCSLFQGFFFAKPDIMEKQALDPSFKSVLKLLNLLNKDIEIDELVHAFEEQADITLQLLRYMNSGQMMLKSEIRSIKHALNLLGKQPLKQWLMLIAYSKSNGGEHAADSPLLVLAKARSQLMSGLMRKRTNSPSKGHEAAFVGLLSLLDVLFKCPLEEILAELHLPREISDAVLHQRGELGELLQLAKAVEQFDVETANHLLVKLKLSNDTFKDAVIESYC